MDDFIYETSVAPPLGKDFVFQQKQWIEIPDSNGGAYSSNKVTFNLDNISNSGDSYFNAKESLIVIPLNLAVEVLNTTALATTTLLDNGTALQNYFVASLKSGAYQIIDKINYKLNGNEVITIDNFENLKINYKFLTSWTQDNVQKRGDELKFAKDTALSCVWDATQGVCNNAISEQFFSPLTGYAVSSNKGRIDRMKKTSFGVLSTAGLVTSSADMAAKYQDFVQVNYNAPIVGGVSNSVTINYSILATFRLADLHPFFESMPLCKNPSQYLSLTLNTNAIQTLTVGIAANGVLTLSAPVVSGITNTTPYQLSPISHYENTGFLLADGALSGTIKSQLGVIQAKGITGSLPHALPNCLFQACFVKMDSDKDLSYSQSPNKTVCWEETYCQYGGNFANVAAGSQVNQLISGTFSKLRKIIIMPFLSPSANGTSGLSPICSTFASEPATCSQFVSNSAISNMNVRLGINNIYPRNIQYTYENYLQSFQGDNALDGGLEKGVSSGLISQSDWETAYGYRVIDLSRHERQNDLQPQSISIQFVNSSAKMMDYIVMVEYEKELGFDTQRGLVRV
jgi:hypothetical protein